MGLKVTASADTAYVAGSQLQAFIELACDDPTGTAVCVDWLTAQLHGFCAHRSCPADMLPANTSNGSTALVDEASSLDGRLQCVPDSLTQIRRV